VAGALWTLVAAPAEAAEGATMNGSVLVAYATKHGSTQEVANAVAEGLHRREFDVELRPAATVDDVSGFDGVVLGGSLHTGRWHRDAVRFLERHSGSLEEVPVAIFAMGPRTLEPHDVAESRAQLERALAELPGVEPVATAIFGGVKLHFPFSRMPASDARDWDTIRAWTDKVAESAGARSFAVASG